MQILNLLAWSKFAIDLRPACWLHQVPYVAKNPGNLVFVDLLQAVETTYIKLADKKCWQSTFIKPVYNLQQTCLFFSLNTLLDDVQVVGVRTRLEVPCEALPQFKLRQTVNRIKYT